MFGIRTAKRLIKRPVFAVERSLYLTGLRSLGQLTLPHFLGLGPGQSGTTWLFKKLSTHPDVFIPKIKEVRYFSNRFHEWPLSRYASQFVEGRDRIRGEITPGYSILRRDRIAFIRRAMPDVRLILTVRNPIERSWSAARRVMSKFGTHINELDEAQFYDYLRKEWEYRPKNGSALSGDYEPGLLEGHYCRAIDNWLSCFPSDQLLVVFFDEMKANPRQYLRKVCQHIGARTEFEWTADLHEVVNRNPEYALPDKFRSFLEDMYCGEIEELHRRLGNPAKRWLTQPTASSQIHR